MPTNRTSGANARTAVHDRRHCPTIRRWHRKAAVGARSWPADSGAQLPGGRVGHPGSAADIHDPPAAAGWRGSRNGRASPDRYSGGRAGSAGPAGGRNAAGASSPAGPVGAIVEVSRISGSRRTRYRLCRLWLATIRFSPAPTHFSIWSISSSGRSRSTGSPSRVTRSSSRRTRRCGRPHRPSPIRRGGDEVVDRLLLQHAPLNTAGPSTRRSRTGLTARCRSRESAQPCLDPDAAGFTLGSCD